METSLGLSKHKILGGIEWLHHPMWQETEDIAQEPQGKRCTFDRISKDFTALVITIRMPNNTKQNTHVSIGIILKVRMSQRGLCACSVS